MVLGGLAVGALCLVALLAPLLAPFGPSEAGSLVAGRLRPPSAVHLLGTDRAARDVLSRIVYGARISLAVGFLSAAVAVVIGTTLGAAAGYLGGVVDRLVMRLVDLVIAFPRLVLLLALAALFRPSTGLIIAILGLTLWPGTARLVRAEVLSLREREFVLAAQAAGCSPLRILFRHIIPSAMAPVLVAATLGVGDSIVLEAGLSFLGLGVPPTTPSWGAMVADGRELLTRAWWLSTFPGLAIAVTVLAFNLVGEGLRESMQPREGT